MTLLPSFSIDESLLACHRQTAEGCIKIAEDLKRYERVIAAQEPTVLVECGTNSGASALWFAKRVPEVITVELIPSEITVDFPDNVLSIIGSTTDPIVVDRVWRLVGNRRCMVVLDSDHSADHVCREIELYGPLVTPGQYLVVEDGILRWLPSWYTGNPLDAIEDTLLDNSWWRRDTEIESMSPVTLYPAGWWRKQEYDG